MDVIVAIIMSSVLSAAPIPSCDALVPRYAQLQSTSTEEERLRDCPPRLEWMCGSEYYA